MVEMPGLGTERDHLALDLGRGPRQGLGVAAGDRDPRSLAGQRLGDPAPNAAAGAQHLQGGRLLGPGTGPGRDGPGQDQQAGCQAQPADEGNWPAGEGVVEAVAQPPGGPVGRTGAGTGGIGYHFD